MFVYGYEASMFQKVFYFFLVYMFCKFSVYDFMGYRYWNTGEQGTDIKEHQIFIWNYLLFSQGFS